MDDQTRCARARAVVLVFAVDRGTARARAGVGGVIIVCAVAGRAYSCCSHFRLPGLVAREHLLYVE